MTANTIEFLAGEKQKVALRGVRAQSRLTAMGQQTTIEQTFVNLEEEAIEVTYTFPVPERAAVCGFEVITGERVLTGQIEERQKASEMYEEAISRGDAAYSLRQHRPDVFSIDVGNIKPGQMALVSITYVAELEVVDDAIRLAYPTVVAPRYATATGTDPLQALQDAQALNPPHLMQVPYGLSLEMVVSLGRPIRSIESPSHAIVVQEAGQHEYRVTLAAGLTETNREIVLQLDLGSEQQPRAESALGPDGQAYVSITFIPELEQSDVPEPSEVIFVLDCSGSMQGPSIARARIALDLCLRNLSSGDTFNICRFGSRFEWMSSEPLAYSQKTLERAIAYVRSINADLGGTELLGPLADILKRRPRAGVSRQVLLLTDGQVSNEPAILALARQHRGHNRIFSFGIGPASSRHLVRGLAEATRGAAEFITAGERIEEKVLRTFSRLATPGLTDLVLKWDGGSEMEPAAAEIPPVFDGDAVTIYTRCAGKSVPGGATLKCMTPAGPLSWTVDIPPVPASSARTHVAKTKPEPAAFAERHADRTLPLLWARRKIQSLEDAGLGEPERQRCIDLSRQFGLMCQETSFIAIEHRTLEERNNGQPASRRIPVAIPRGWHGVEALYCLAASPMRAAGAASPRTRSVARIVSDFMYRWITPPPESDSMMHSSVGEARAASSFSADSSLDGWSLLLSKQQADGSFDAPDAPLPAGWDQALKAAEQWLASRMPLQAAAPAMPDDLIRRVITTLVVLIVLHRSFESEQGSWRRAERKAIRYLAGALGHTVNAMRAQLADLFVTAG